MGNIRLLSSALLALTLVACGDDGGGSNTPDALHIIDAPPVDTAPPIDQPPAITYDFSCYQNSAPANVAATVTVAGTAQEINAVAMNLGPSAGVTVTACKGNCTGQNNLGSVGPTDNSGTFTTAALTTGGTALDGYIKATKASYWDTYLYPHAPLSENLAGAPVLMVNDLIVGALGQIGTPQQDGNGIVGVAVTDCATPPVGISGAAVSVMSGANGVGDDPLDAGAVFPQAAGTYLISNVPPGDVTIHATYVQNGTTYTFLVNDVTAYADALTTAQLKPGY